MEFTPHQATQLSTKKVWRLKKYNKTEDEIQLQQKQYENMEFSPKKSSSKRPRMKPGQSQEFVFVDLSPKKKEEREKNKKQGRVSRLFRLGSHQDLKQEIQSPLLVANTESSAQLQPSPEMKTEKIQSQQIPTLKRSYTTLSMTISDSGRAVLQPSISSLNQQPSLSASSSTSDLFSLTRNNSTRQSYYSRSPIPSPNRASSPVAMNPGNIPDRSASPVAFHSFEEHEDDAHRAFTKIIKKSDNNLTRRRTNTLSSLTSNHSKTHLSRTHSISSLSSIYTKTARISPSRANLLRQATTPCLTPLEDRTFTFEDVNHSYFDSVHRDERRSHKKQQSISAQLGPGLGAPLELGAPMELGAPLIIAGDMDNSEPESPFEMGDGLSSQFHEDHGLMVDHGMKFETDDFFDFNAFVNCD